MWQRLTNQITALINQIVEMHSRVKTNLALLPTMVRTSIIYSYTGYKTPIPRLNINLSESRCWRASSFLWSLTILLINSQQCSDYTALIIEYLARPCNCAVLNNLLQHHVMRTDHIGYYKAILYIPLLNKCILTYVYMVYIVCSHMTVSAI